MTGGKPFFVKYKLLIGTFLLGSIHVSGQNTLEKAKDNTPPIETLLITCYKPSVSRIPLEIKAKIVDENNKPLRNVIVNIKTKVRTDKEPIIHTNEDGEVTIEATRGDFIDFRLPGYEIREVAVRELIKNNVIIMTETLPPTPSCYMVTLPNKLDEE